MSTPQYNYADATKAQGSVPPPKYPAAGDQPYVYKQPSQTTIIYTTQQLGHSPTSVHCPQCNTDVTTHVDYESGVCSWLGAAGFCLFGCWCGCCLIPFFADSFKDSKHTCPVCQAKIGERTRL
jgi:lipopolysaccharide-induced tumor necrosis factor-alpha factor